MAKSKTKSAAKSKTAAKSKPVAAKPAAATLTKAVASQENLDQSGREFYNEELKQDAAARAAKRSKAKAKAAATVAAVIENGIRRPGADTLCGKVWATLDDLRTAGVDATAKNARDALKDAGMADATVRTQYARWRKYHSTVDAS